MALPTSKTDVLPIFNSFKIMVETQFNTRIKSLQTDGGTEFKPLSSVLSSSGMLHKIYCLYIPQQNGSVERKNRHLVEVGLSLLAHSSVPQVYWSYAFQTAVFLINRLPTPVLDFKSPYSLLYGKSHMYNLLKTFGCLCFPYLRPYNDHKLQFRSKECVFLGYSSYHKGYLCLDHSSGRLFVSRHVIFNEYAFPFRSCVSQPSLKQTSPDYFFPLGSLLSLHSLPSPPIVSSSPPSSLL